VDQRIIEENAGFIGWLIVIVYFFILLLALRKPGARIPLFRLSVILVIVGFVAINFLVSLPKFLVAENLTYATLFTISLVFSDGKGGKLLSMLLSMFVAGRISGVILTPEGKVEALTVSHILLEVHLIFIGIISWVLLAMPKDAWEIFEKEFAEPPSDSG
jgi:hypothetical protein